MLVSWLPTDAPKRETGQRKGEGFSFFPFVCCFWVSAYQWLFTRQQWLVAVFSLSPWSRDLTAIHLSSSGPRESEPQIQEASPPTSCGTSVTELRFSCSLLKSQSLERQVSGEGKGALIRKAGNLGRRSIYALRPTWKILRSRDDF